MLAIEVYRQTHCSRCAEPLAESMHIDNDGRYRAEAIRCYGCVSIAHASAAFVDDTAASALRYKVTLRR